MLFVWFGTMLDLCLFLVVDTDLNSELLLCHILKEFKFKKINCNSSRQAMISIKRMET